MLEKEAQVAFQAMQNVLDSLGSNEVVLSLEEMDGLDASSGEQRTDAEIVEDINRLMAKPDDVVMQPDEDVDEVEELVPPVSLKEKEQALSCLNRLVDQGSLGQDALRVTSALREIIASERAARLQQRDMRDWLGSAEPTGSTAAAGPATLAASAAASGALAAPVIPGRPTC